MERSTYSEIKNVLLLYYWRGCRDYGTSGWTVQQVSAWVYSELESNYEHGIENLMLEVACCVLFVFGFAEQLEYHRGEVVRMISDGELGNWLQNLPVKELEEFEFDLKFLSFIS
ncbi:hypothetical protein AB3464_03040 [Pseudomonas asplenii]|uniref:hypothetical protein n=1 Tax=Pseudomonas asplenii TaxID=53407 RepID=UPI0037C602F1